MLELWLALGLGLVLVVASCVSMWKQWRHAAGTSDKHALQIWALHTPTRTRGPCYCLCCRQARRVLGLAERPRLRARV